MNAIYLHLPDGTPTKWSMCAECKTVAAPGNYELSDKCCTCYDCGGPLPKDQRIPYSEGKGKALYHRECEAKRRALRDAEILEKAELIADYDGPVFLEGVGYGSFGDGFFSNVDELSEHLDDDDGDLRPAFAYCCTARAVHIDLDSILEDATEEMCDGCRDDLNGVEKLQAAVEAFNEANESVQSWDPDYKRKVAVPIP